MKRPVCPYPREDGYWMVEAGQPRFVPFVPVMAPGAVIVPFPGVTRERQVSGVDGDHAAPAKLPQPECYWYFGIEDNAGRLPERHP